MPRIILYYCQHSVKSTHKPAKVQPAASHRPTYWSSTWSRLKPKAKKQNKNNNLQTKLWTCIFFVRKVEILHLTSAVWFAKLKLPRILPIGSFGRSSKMEGKSFGGVLVEHLSLYSACLTGKAKLLVNLTALFDKLQTIYIWILSRKPTTCWACSFWNSKR